MTQNTQAIRYGLSIPLSSPLNEQKDKIAQVRGMGFTDVWSAEAFGIDGISPLVLASQWAPELRLGTAILPAYTRGAALLAQTIGTIAQIAPGRVAIGIGTSSDIIVENFNGIKFEEPYKKVKDILEFLNKALTGEKVTAKYNTFEIKGFRLAGAVPTEPVPILLAALREGMLRLAGKKADGAILNWLTPEDVKEIVPIVKDASKQEGAKNKSPEIVARLFVCPNPDTKTVMEHAKRVMAGYLNVPVYKAFHEWRGRSDILKKHWELWAKGERAESLDAIPDELVDDLFIHGTPEQCFERFEEYRQAGISTPIMAVMPFGDLDEWEAIQSLQPSNFK